jgi:exodeoxyribonuclease V alpha subunit
MNSLSSAKLQELVIAARLRIAQTAKLKLELKTESGVLKTESGIKFSNELISSPSPAWVWNEQQKEAIELALGGKDFCLIGAAGTGKTAVTKEISRRIIQQFPNKTIQKSTKHLEYGAPGVIGVSFTRRAVRNLRHALIEISGNCLTIHKLIEFQPVRYEMETDNGPKKTVRFEPARNRFNPLCNGIVTIMVDESSMVSSDLFDQLLDALPSGTKTRFIFIGDLHQLPPVYGRAILGYKLTSLPVVELTHVYRQALQSPIIRLAHKIKNGEQIPLTEKFFEDELPHGQVLYRPWKKKLSLDDALHTAQAFCREQIDLDVFNPETDVILCPYNKNFGTLELNKAIAQHFGAKRDAIVFEIISGYLTFYFAVGDRVLYDKEDAEIVKIVRNGQYVGKAFQSESTTLDRWGTEQDRSKLGIHIGTDFNMDTFLKASIAIDEDKKNESSHIITLRYLDDDKEVEIKNVGDVSNLLFSYALTIHKAQGSEWDKVYLLLSHLHNKMLSRELLYTAVTRAKKELYIICEPDRGTIPGSLTFGASRARIKGDTLKEKIAFFKQLMDEKQLFEEVEE